MTSTKRNPSTVSPHRGFKRLLELQTPHNNPACPALPSGEAGMIDLYTQSSALRAYMERVGAEPQNFRRYVVKEKKNDGYHVEIAKIRITADLIIESSDPKYAPTEDEQQQIAKELAGANFPTSVRASRSQVDDLKKSGQVTGTLFTLFDVTRKEVIMCQERREGEQGKSFIPWTMYAEGQDAKWQQMEPDDLPFWKPPKKRHKANIMVHEGAGKAEHIDRLLNDITYMKEEKAHPWIEELEQYEHWGAIGGARSMRRCDYSELLGQKPEGHIAYSCDNDAPGVEAVKTFSRNLPELEIRMVRFDNMFGPGWDLADPLPDELLNTNGTAKRQLSEFMEPATWATKQVSRKKDASTGKKESGRPAFTLTDQFRQEWLHTVSPTRFCHETLLRQLFTTEEFDNLARPFSDVQKTSELVMRSVVGKALGLKWDPGKDPGFCRDDDGSFINTYVPSRITSYSTEELRKLKPDYARPFEQFLEHLFPIATDRHHVCRMIATLMAVIGVKIIWALLLMSENHGVGKSTLCTIIGRVLGRHNAVSVTASNLVNGSFTEWAAKQLVVVSEILADHAPKVYDKLKEIITEPEVSYHKKFHSPVMIKNCLHVIAGSNFTMALLIPNEDRRWLLPKVTENLKEKEYWDELYDWLENQDGYRKVKRWAEEYVEKHGAVRPSERAPDTTTKTDMILEGYTPGKQLIHKTLAWGKHVMEVNGKVDLPAGRLLVEMERFIKAVKAGYDIVMYDLDGSAVIRELLYDGKQTPLADRPHAVRKVAAATTLGCYYVGKGRITISGNGFNARIISTSPRIAREDPNQTVKEIAAHKEPKDQTDPAGNPSYINLAQLVRDLSSL